MMDQVVHTAVDITAALGWGVYLLAHNGRVVYVGKSKCPLARIAAHRSLARKKPVPWLSIPGIVFDQVQVIPSHPDRIDALEQALIAFHRPRHNIRHKPPAPALPKPAPLFRLPAHLP